MSFKNFQKGHTPILVLVIIIVIVSLGAYFVLQGNTNTNTSLGEVPVNQRNLTLTLDSPNQNTKAYDDEILIRGKTLPNTTVVLFNETDEEILQSDARGNFKGTLLLSQGKNLLTVTAFSDTGEEKSLNLEVDYSI